MDWKNVGIIILVIGVVGLTFGCVDNNTSNASTSPTYERHVVVCPNPDCILHSIDGSTNGYSGNIRPIDMEYDWNTRKKLYLCQVCGEQWGE